MQIGNAGEALADSPRHEPSGRVADLYDHLLAQCRQGSLDLFRLRSMLRIEHTADHSLVDPKAPRQFGVVDLLVAHRQVQRQFRREPKRHRHQAMATLGDRGHRDLLAAGKAD